MKSFALMLVNRRVVWNVFLCLGLFSLTAVAFAAEPDGYLHTDRGTLFPIGFYEIPKEEADFQALAKSGVNIVRCSNREDLDRVGAAGIFGWVPLSVQAGPTDALRKKIEDLRDHPALAVWEGPDEVIWNFTAYSALEKIAGFTREDWWSQKPKAVEYARREAAKILPQMREAIALVRELDGHDRPFWINEAAESDVIYVRGYMDVIDITGCDYYPVKAATRDIVAMAKITDRWRMTGRGKPVWMVLQAFSWHKGNPEKYTDEAYPTFDETRFMAWVSIVHGARGIFYWGAHAIDRPDFLPSIFAMTSELAALQPFLIAPQVEGSRIQLIEGDLERKTKRGVTMTLRQSGDEWLLVLVNEDDTRHLGVEVTGLEALNGRELHLLYGDESSTVDRGEFLTRMQAYETKVFATSRKWETDRLEGRDFGVVR